jgi:multicomponent Na+:H+ antiporter subunit F
MRFSMISLHLAVATFLTVNVVAGLFRVIRGPTAADRMLAAQLFCTTAVAVLLLLAEALAMPAARDVALVFALLAALATAAFVTRGWQPPVPAPSDGTPGNTFGEPPSRTRPEGAGRGS